MNYSNASSPTTYALLGHSSTYYGSPAAAVASHAGAAAGAAAGSVPTTHAHVYQSIVYPHHHHHHHHQYHHSLHHTNAPASAASDSRNSLYPQPAGSIYRLSSSDGGNHQDLGPLHGLTGSPPHQRSAAAAASSAPPASPAEQHLGGDTSSVVDAASAGVRSADAPVWRPY